MDWELRRDRGRGVKGAEANRFYVLGNTHGSHLAICTNRICSGRWCRAGCFFLLAKARRKIGQCEKGGVNFFDEFAVGFRFLVDTLPFRVVPE